MLCLRNSESLIQTSMYVYMDETYQNPPTWLLSIFLFYYFYYMIMSLETLSYMRDFPYIWFPFCIFLVFWVCLLISLTTFIKLPLIYISKPAKQRLKSKKCEYTFFYSANIVRTTHLIIVYFLNLFKRTYQFCHRWGIYILDLFNCNNDCIIFMKNKNWNFIDNFHMQNIVACSNLFEGMQYWYIQNDMKYYISFTE